MTTGETLFTDHTRHWRDNRFVYPVVSRRSKGVSIGINLNPDKVCNFDCIYCQVDRRSESETTFVETEDLYRELREMVEWIVSGKLFEDEKFSTTRPEYRRLNDFAFSGDGEPTTFKNFAQIVGQVAQIKREAALDDVKMVLITNASMLHRPAVQAGLEILDESRGEVWAKLEAGTEEYFQKIDRTKIPFRRVLDNITAAAQRRPIVLQSLFMTVDNEAPPKEEIEAFCERLVEICDAGGEIMLVQIYTVARRPTEDYVGALTSEQLSQIAKRVEERAGLPTEVFPGSA